MGERGRKKPGVPKCRGCGRERTRGDTVKIGGHRYHPECAEAKPKMRQRWDKSRLRWIRL